MFSMKIVDSDAFMDMPQSSQLLYFQLAMRADDDGFIGNPKKIMRMIGSSDDDYKILIAKRFILVFPSGICVIKHWLIHNYIAKDRYTETAYLPEKTLVKIKENGAYTECIQNDIQLDDTGKVRLGKVRLENICMPKENNFDIFWEAYPKKELKKRSSEIWATKKFSTKLPEILAFVEKAKLTIRWKKGFIKQPTAFLNGECWNDDLTAYNIDYDRKQIGNVLATEHTKTLSDKMMERAKKNA